MELFRRILCRLIGHSFVHSRGGWGCTRCGGWHSCGKDRKRWWSCAERKAVLDAAKEAR